MKRKNDGTFLKCLGSSSSGNCYILTSKGQSLIIEAGIRFDKVLECFDYDIKGLCGVVYSHSHFDHSAYISDYAKRGFPVLTNPDAAKKADLFGVMPMDIDKKYKIGYFAVKAIETPHNVPCYSFIIDCPDGIRILFITDTSWFKYKVKGVNCLMVEANYSQSVIEEKAVQNIWSKSANTNHMSIDDAIKVIKRHQTKDLQDVVLLHLSDGNSDSSKFKRWVAEECGFEPYIADEGLEIKLKKEEF